MIDHVINFVTNKKAKKPKMDFWGF